MNERLEQMQERLRLPTLPRRIECCDISHLGGGDTVGAIVAVKDGVPDKKHYRTFHVRGARGTGAEAGDDYAAMYEVLARRFRRGRTAKEVKDGEADARAVVGRGAAGAARAGRTDADAEAREQAEQIDWELPDLFVVDGGKGQLNVALAAAHDLGLHGMPIVALAKEKENVLGDTLVDRVYLPGPEEPDQPEEPLRLALLSRARPRRGAPLLEPRTRTARQVRAHAQRARRRGGDRARRRRRRCSDARGA